MNIRLALLILVLNVFHNAFGQVECGTIVTEKTRAFLREMKVGTLEDMFSDGETVKLAISAHIVRRSNGRGGLTSSQLESVIANANAIYGSIGISFFLLGEINYIDSDRYHDFSRSDEHRLTTPYNVENTINIYFFNTIMINDSGFCGYTHFPDFFSGMDYIMVKNKCVLNGNTLSHELGHYFSLYHTHGKTNSGTTDELVDGSNCATAGDDICDTPADPNLSDKVNEFCSYTRTARDANGATYVPNTRNLMSYSRKGCRDEFSAEQRARMLSAYHQYKSYLISIANFDAPVTRVCQRSQVAFNNHSLGTIVGHHWSFPGGSPSTSTNPNPTITYSTAGTYDVTLTVTGEDGKTSIRQRVGYINVIGTLLVKKEGSFEETVVEETIINEDNDITFERTRASASDGNHSMKMNFFNSFTTEGEEDYLVFSTLNTQVKKAFVLTFDHAYAYYTDRVHSRSDSLAIVYRRGCGPTEEWVEIWRESGDGLSTIEEGEVRSPFTPSSAEQWIRNTIVFEVDEALETVEFAFKTVNGFLGNNLYLDNYAIHPIISNVEVTNADCPNAGEGSLVVETRPETGPFTYQLNDGEWVSSPMFSGLSGGEYTLSLRDGNGMEFSEKITVDDWVSVPVISKSGAGLSIGITSQDITIQWLLNGSPIGGAGSTSYLPLVHGEYTVEISKGRCTVTSGQYMTALPQIDQVHVNNTDCHNTSTGSVEVDASRGINPIMYQLNDGAFRDSGTFPDLGIGSYTVTIQDATGATASKTITIEADKTLKQPQIINNDNELSVQVENGLTVQWLLDGSPIDGADDLTFTAEASGSYTVRVFSGACTITSEPEDLIILGLNEIEKELDFYPNPASDELVIKMSKVLQRRTTSLRVRDFTGKVIMSDPVQSRLKIDRLRQGVYLLELVGTGFVISRKFVKIDQ